MVPSRNHTKGHKNREVTFTSTSTEGRKGEETRQGVKKVTVRQAYGVQSQSNSGVVLDRGERLSKDQQFHLKVNKIGYHEEAKDKQPRLVTRNLSDFRGSEDGRTLDGVKGYHDHVMRLKKRNLTSIEIEKKLHDSRKSNIIYNIETDKSIRQSQQNPITQPIENRNSIKKNKSGMFVLAKDNESP